MYTINTFKSPCFFGCGIQVLHRCILTNKHHTILCYRLNIFTSVNNAPIIFLSSYLSFILTNWNAETTYLLENQNIWCETYMNIFLIWKKLKDCSPSQPLVILYISIYRQLWFLSCLSTILVFSLLTSSNHVYCVACKIILGRTLEQFFIYLYEDHFSLWNQVKITSEFLSNIWKMQKRVEILF